MKNIFKLFILFLIFSFNSPIFAIDWIQLVSPKGKIVYLDKDSITAANGYFYYNIKFKNSHTNQDVVLTMQSGVAHQFSARIKAYKPDEYEMLNGDYQNILKNSTTQLELVTYDSIVNTCYKEVKKIKRPQQLPIIEVE